MARFHNGMRPVHPGKILREEYLVPLDLSIAELAKELHVGTAQIDAIVRGDAARGQRDRSAFGALFWW